MNEVKRAMKEVVSPPFARATVAAEDEEVIALNRAIDRIRCAKSIAQMIRDYSCDEKQEIEQRVFKLLGIVRERHQ